MGSSRVFISYRRDDAAGFSHAVHDRLADHLGADQVFMDVHDIDAGADFAQRLQAAAQRCDVLIVLIGKRWTGPRPDRVPRIHDADDWVRIEVAAALRRGIKVVPVLLDGATMPAPQELPADLLPLTRLNAVDLRSSRLDADVRDLVGTAVRAVGGTWPPLEPGSRLSAIVGGAYALFAGGAVVIAMLGSLFVDQLSDATLIGLCGLVAAAAVALRLPLHACLRSLPRARAFRVAAVVHAAAFIVLATGSSDLEAGLVFFFGVVPAGALFLASYGMQRLARV